MTNGQNMQAIMPNPSAMDPTKHVRYNLGMVLGVDDFVQEFTYHNAQRAWLARDVTGYGTLWGLGVTAQDDNEKGPRILVECGAALNQGGQLIHVSPAQCAHLNEWLVANRDKLIKHFGSTPSDGDSFTLYAVLAHDECETDEVPLAGEPCRSEQQLTAASRLKDYFKLQLHLNQPQHSEQFALRNFIKALAAVPVVSPPASVMTLDEFEQAVGESIVLNSSPPASPPLSEFENCEFDLSGASIPEDQVTIFMRAAFRIWTVVLRPQCRPDWLASDESCSEGKTRPVQENYLLLAEVNVTLSINAINDEWLVADAAAIQVNDRERPYLLDQRMLQEWSLSKTEVLAPDNPQYGVVAAGKLLGNNTPVGPILGGLRIVKITPGAVIISFDNYQKPDGNFQYIINITEEPTASVKNPVIRFLEFSEQGILLKANKGTANIPVAELKLLPLMLEITRIG